MIVMLPRCINKFAHPLFSNDVEAHCKLLNSENQNNKWAETFKIIRFCHRTKNSLILFFCFKSFSILWLTYHSNVLFINFKRYYFKNNYNFGASNFATAHFSSFWKCWIMQLAMFPKNVHSLILNTKVYIWESGKCCFETPESRFSFFSFTHYILYPK